jgi:hypothetical protein
MGQFPSFDRLQSGPGVVRLLLSPAAVHLLHTALQAGFLIRSEIGVSVSSFLKDHLGLSPRYIEERINTVFLNGKPVDDIETAIVEEGATLALSSAMPGLVGATMRRKGFYASLRSAISYDDKAGASTVKNGIIRLKLFNLLMADLGVPLLKKGIFIRLDDFCNFLARRPRPFHEAVEEATLDGRPINPTSIDGADLRAVAEWVEVRVCESR